MKKSLSIGRIKIKKILKTSYTNQYLFKNKSHSKTQMDKILNIGIIGCGYWGPNIIRNFNDHEDCNVKYCADLDDERLSHIKEKYPDIKTIKDYKEIIEDKDIDAVAIITPPSTHYALAKIALENNKHVLVEKPLTDNSVQARELIEIAEKNNKVLMVDHTFEYTSAVRKVKEILKQNQLGKIFTIDMNRVNLGLFQKIGVIWDLAPHDVSILNFILDSYPISVRAFGESFIQEGIEDDARIALKYPGNITANLHVSWLSPIKGRKTTIIGNKKMLIYDDIEQVDKIKTFDKGVELKPNNLPKDEYYDTWEEFKMVYRHGKEKVISLYHREPLKVMVEHFIDCIKNNIKPISDGDSGLNVVKIIEAAKTSLKNDGKEVKLD